MRRRVRFFWYSLFAGALFFEWMVPLKLSTDTGRVDIFLLAFAFLMVMDVLRLPLWLRFVVKPLFLIFILYRVFFAPAQFAFFDVAWLLEAWQHIRADSALLLSGSWIGMAPFVRTAFFLLFIWLMEAVMFRYVVKGGRVFWILVLTVLYLSVLDSFTPFDGGAAIVRTFCYGFAMLAFSRLDQLLGQVCAQGHGPGANKGRGIGRRLRLLPWFSGALAFVFLAVAIGLLAPKSEARWLDPVSFITSYDERAGGGVGGGVRKVGYSEDDSRLGGPFEQDETVVFQSEIAEPYYWRGEAKDLYDGQGWHRQQAHLQKVIRDQAGSDYYNVEASLFHNLETKLVTQETAFAENAVDQFSALFTAGQLRGIHATSGLHPNDVFGTGNLSGFRMKDGYGLTRYTIDVEQPIINIQQLRESSTAYPDDIEEQYLQLPGDLPMRVMKLAQEIVKDKDNAYDRVIAVENFLRLGSDFAYETENVRVPPEGEDFVDHFLFETQRGYCDHFSTSMVVLLRANGIPARWVKGFAPGDRRFNLKTGKYEVTVTNADAHSWPEVYFEGVGWLPFEPTPTFSNPTEIQRELAEVASPDVEASQPEVPQITNFDDIRLGEDVDSTAADAANSSSFSWQWVGIGLLAIVIILSGVLWVLKPRLWQWRLKRLQGAINSENSNGLLDAYERLLQLLGRRYGTRKPQQTVREYVKASVHLGGKSSEPFVELTKLYEQTRYANSPPTKEVWQVVHERWRRLLEELRA